MEYDIALKKSKPTNIKKKKSNDKFIFIKIDGVIQNYWIIKI